MSMQMIPMPEECYDLRDPAFHSAEGDRAIRGIMHQFHSWWTQQAINVQARYCHHGRYVGFGAALGYRCPGCVAEGVS